MGGIGACEKGVLDMGGQKPDERDEYKWMKYVHCYHYLEQFLKFQIILKEGTNFSMLTKRNVRFKVKKL